MRSTDPDLEMIGKNLYGPTDGKPESGDAAVSAFQSQAPGLHPILPHGRLL